VVSHNPTDSAAVTPKLSSWRIFAKILLIFSSFVLLQEMVCSVSFAGEPGRYTVVAGGEDNAYLVDTSTGFVWYLTHRTMAIGREPIAIPYKFIQISPKKQPEFLLEKVPRKGNAKESEDVK